RPVPNVPYAHAQHPGGPADSHIDSANGKGPAPSRADAHADELLADASGVYAGGNPGQPFSGASGESHTVVNSDGSMVVRTHSFVANATFGAPPNAIVIEKVSVDITVKASGVHVTATHPAPSGVPQQSVEYVFGEGYVDAGADAGLAADSGAAFLTSGFSLGDLGGGFGDNGFSMGDSSVNANNGTAAAIRHTAALLRANRQPLALLFLLWETLLMAGA